MPQLIGGVYSLGGSVESHLIPPPSLHDGEGSSFPDLVPSDDVVDSDSVMGIKPGDSGVVIGYQVDEFTHTWSAEQFVAHPHIYPGFTGKVSSLTQGVMIMPFWIRLLLTSNKDWTPSSLIHLRHWNWTLPWRSLVLLHLQYLLGFSTSVTTLSDNSKPQLASSIHTCKLWCQARALLAPVSLATKLSASNLIPLTFLATPAAFGFQASTPPDDICLNSANRKVDQSPLRFSDWSWCHCTCYS